MPPSPMSPPTNSYEKMPGESRPLQATHIDVLAVTAALAGLTPVAIKACRVLEIGCAVGGNLLPMAQALPESTFVGIDLSPRQIALAQKTATGAGLKNIRFEVRDFTALPEDFGHFDYIIAHGIYHWVNPAAREQLLGTIKRLLSPQGVAYVNYHVYPGWRAREMFRDILVAKTAGQTDPRARVAEARQFIAFLSVQGQASGEGVYANQLRQEASFLSTVPDEYFLHEYLEADPNALYFQQFVDQLTLNELTYVGEIKPGPSRLKLAEALKNEQPDLVHDWTRLEQYVDHIQGGFIRRSLICHAEQVVSREPRIEAIESFSISCRVVPTVGQGNVRSNDPIPFRFPDGMTVNITEPHVKTILVALAQVWPLTVSFEEMLEVIRVDLKFGESFAVAGSPERVLVLQTLAVCHAMTLVDLHAAPLGYALQSGEKPLASPLARFQAREGKSVTNVLHALVVSLSKVDRLILAHLNGNRDRAALVGVIKAAIAKGILPDPTKDSQAATEAGLTENIEQVLEQSLARLAADAFLSASA